jgi:hypothetical protein
MIDSRRQFAALLAAVVLLATALSAAADSSGDANISKNKLLPGEANTVKVVKEAKPSVAAITIQIKGKIVNPLKNMPPAMRQFF